MPFINIQVTPVMEPLLEPPGQATALFDYPLIHERDRNGWKQWFEAAARRSRQRKYWDRNRRC